MASSAEPSVDREPSVPEDAAPSPGEPLIRWLVVTVGAAAAMGLIVAVIMGRSVRPRSLADSINARFGFLAGFIVLGGARWRRRFGPFRSAGLHPDEPMAGRADPNAAPDREATPDEPRRSPAARLRAAWGRSRKPIDEADAE